MKRLILSGAVAVACVTATIPLAMTAAKAEGTQPARAASVRTRTIAGQTPRDMAALKAAAQRDAAATAATLGLSQADKLTVRSVIKDTDGATHVHYDRTFKGMPVVHGDVVVHRNAAGRVTGHDGTFDGAVTVGTTPRLTAAQAAQRGLAAARSFAAAKESGLTHATAGASSLVVFVDAWGRQHLGYRMTTTGIAADHTPSRIRSIVDADSGTTLQTFDLVVHATGKGHGIFVGAVELPTTEADGGYELRNPETGNYTTDSENDKIDGWVFTSPTNAFGNGTASDRASAAADAQFGADTTFRFYKEVMGRNGIWDNGEGTRSRVHFGHNYDNAFWDGRQMTYGDGPEDKTPLTELDVSGHEMSHAVTENTAHLDYDGEAGGLNEATSDIEGTGVEWFANLASDKPDYVIGELLSPNGTPLRYLDKPSKDGDSPDCYSSAVAGMDPHAASGPLNHWFYLASEGSGKKSINGVSYDSPTCNGKTVKGADHVSVEKVWYRALATKLTSAATYAQAREGAITSAVELYGAGSQVCRSVQDAFDAIDVPAGSARCDGSPDPTPSPGPR